MNGEVPTAVPSSEHATATMRANRGRDTGPEITRRSALHASGLRFRKNLRPDLDQGHRVRPDNVFTGVRLAMFVDGCFWHGCKEHRSLPVSNSSFWKAEIEGTARRDRQQTLWLREAGWVVLRVWEHDVPDTAAQLISSTVADLRSQKATP